MRSAHADELRYMEASKALQKSLQIDGKLRR